MEKNLLQIQNVLKSNGILISFLGRFSQGIIEELKKLYKEQMKKAINIK